MAYDTALTASMIPASLEAEQALLGILVYDNAAYERIDGLTAEHFHEATHGRIFATIETIIRRSQLAEPIMLAEKLAADQAFQALGGIAYLAQLVDEAPSPNTARDYAALIKDAAIRRELIRIAGDVDQSARPGMSDLSGIEQVEAAEQALFNIAEKGQAAGGLKAIGSGVAKAIDMAAAAYQRDGGLSGISTGLADLDRILGGLHASDLVIIAARPSMGKTALGANIAYNVAKAYAYEVQPDGTHKTTAGGRVAFFSLEMSEEQLALRLMSEVSGIPSERVRRGEIKAHEFGQIRDAAALITELPLSIDDTGGISIAKLATRARRMKRSGGLDLIVVDYVQLVTTDGRRKADNRVQEVTEITMALKSLAKELSVPVVALAQLSRQVEQREDKRPQLSDLRESGSIEQDADVVMFIYREAYYLGRSEPDPSDPKHEAWVDKMAEAHGKADILIGKQRHGPIGTVRLHFDETLTKFSNLAREPRYEPSRVYRGTNDD